MQQFLLLLFILSTCNAAKPPCPVSLNLVQFSSRNLINNLTWEPTKNLDGLFYTVKYKTYGTSSYQKKSECTNITRTWCDLTNETNNVSMQYYAKVILHDRNCSAPSKEVLFDPRKHSKMDPPIVSLFPSGRSIEINLSHAIKDIQKLFQGLQYFIYWDNNGSVETEWPYYKLEHLEYETTYCVQAQIEWFGFDTDRSENVCATTGSDHSSQHAVTVMLSILPVALITIIAAVIICAIYHYIHITNLKQPTFLNITTTDNRNALLIDAQNVTINVITVDSGTLNIPQTVITNREKTKEESESPVIVHLTDSDYHTSSDSGITEHEDDETDEDHGYVSLQEQKVTARPTISPYDMPQTLHEPMRPLSSSSDIVHEGDLYGRIKCNSTDEAVQEKEYLHTVQTEYAPKESLVNDPYLPHGDSKVPFIDKFKENLCELEEESFTGQDSDNIKMIEDIHVNETSALFLDWSPDNPDVYIPNVLKKRELESCIQQCQTEKEALLSELYSSLEMKGNSEEEDLEELEDRWGLHVQGLEK
ncbi:interleukin-20 receptor subunit alpha-like [Hyperolius riggenbachi]|uniref:interleukin-20 receptor subunit alpha-like n=1 Tax=Hyperolius riggenbachi TaxID=752182 RepID=UPI0035A2D1B7